MPTKKTIMVDVDTNLSLSGNQSSISYAGLAGNNAVSHTGTFTAVSPATGVQTGTAGAGTTTTSLVKPTAADDWTANDLIGSFVRILSGPGAGEIRAIRDNATTTITIPAITGLTNTSVFDIVTPQYTITSLSITENQPSITISNCVITGATIEQSNQVYFVNCVFDTPNIAGSLTGSDNRVISFSNCVLSGEASVLLDDSQRVVLNNVVLNDGTIRVRRCQYVNADVVAFECTGTSLALWNATLVELAFNGDNCDTTPLTMSSCAMMRVQGGGLVGTGHTGYGFTVNDGGRYDVTGATLTGDDGDFTIDGNEDTYVSLAAEGAILVNTTQLMVG